MAFDAFTIPQNEIPLFRWEKDISQEVEIHTRWIMYIQWDFIDTVIGEEEQDVIWDKQQVCDGISHL